MICLRCGSSDEAAEACEARLLRELNWRVETPIGQIEGEALPSVERLVRAVPERLPTGNPEVDRLRAAWNEGRGAVLAALRDEPEAER